MIPEQVVIDDKSGLMTPNTGRYRKRLSELRGLFQDAQVLEAEIRAKGDPVVYEVIEYKKGGSDLFFGTTAILPGKVNAEYYMTRGHFHKRRDMGEVYYTRNGAGILLLESPDGETNVIEMRPGTCAFIAPNWAHRSINIGAESLVFVWVCSVDAGHDYGQILRTGMRKIVVEREGKVAVLDNPSMVP